MSELLKKALAVWDRVTRLPSQLEGLSTLLKTLGLTAAALAPAWATLTAYWRSTDTTLSVNIRSLLIGQIVLGMCLAGLLYVSWRRQRKLRTLTENPLVGLSLGILTMAAQTHPESHEAGDFESIFDADSDDVADALDALEGDGYMEQEEVKGIPIDMWVSTRRGRQLIKRMTKQGVIK